MKIEKAVKDSFIGVIQAQEKIYKRLNEIVLREKSALAGKDLKAIDSIVAEEEKMIVGIKELEDKKYGLFETMAETAGYKKGDAYRLQDVLGRYDKNDSREIEKAVESLLGVVKTVDAVNASNASALKNYIEYVEFAKNMKEKLDNPPSATYAPDGIKEIKPDSGGSKINTTI